MRKREREHVCPWFATRCTLVSVVYIVHRTECFYLSSASSHRLLRLEDDAFHLQSAFPCQTNGEVESETIQARFFSLTRATLECPSSWPLPVIRLNPIVASGWHHLPSWTALPEKSPAPAGEYPLAAIVARQWFQLEDVRDAAVCVEYFQLLN